MKVKKLKKDELRVIKIPRKAIEELLWEDFMEHGSRYFDMLCADHVWYQMIADPDLESALVVLEPRGMSLGQEELETLLDEQPYTTDSLFYSGYNEKKYMVLDRKNLKEK